MLLGLRPRLTRADCENFHPLVGEQLPTNHFPIIESITGESRRASAQTLAGLPGAIRLRNRR
jgi:hypothetical protein